MKCQLLEALGSDHILYAVQLPILNHTSHPTLPPLFTL